MLKTAIFVLLLLKRNTASFWFLSNTFSDIVSQTVLYVDQDTPYTQQDGSEAYPYSSLQQALSKVKGPGSIIQFVQSTYTISQFISFTTEKSSNITIDFR